MKQDNRPSFDSIYMNLALNLAKRSHHPSIKVGCVIVADDYSQVYSLGYNGTYKGGPNESDSNVPGQSNDIHAEMNALIKFSAHKDTKKIVYITHSPCILCAKMLINLGNVINIIYNEPYRENDGLKLLISNGIKVKRLISTEDSFI